MQPLLSRGNLLNLGMLLVLVAIVGGLGAIASVDAPVFYEMLNKPSWAPHADLFGPVWTVLYVLIAFSAWLLLSEHEWRHVRFEMTVYILQLIVNTAWSWLFFGLHDGHAALLDIGMLWMAILINFMLFWRMHRWAGALLLPYLFWVSFAAALNYTLCDLNPQL
ncbi:MAG: TspO/MBR family protein [Steroidobacteraceae bacterium]